MKTKDEPAIDFSAEVHALHVFGIDGLDTNMLWDKASKYCSDEGFSGRIVTMEQDNEDPNDDAREFITRLDWASTQGVPVTYFPGKKSHIHFTIPPFGSTGDMKLIFGYLKALRELYPDCGIFYDRTHDQGQFAICEGNYEMLIVQALSNMMSLIEHCTLEDHLGVAGIYHSIILPSQQDYADMSLEDLTMKTMNDFISLQWDYHDYVDAPEAKVETAAGEKYNVRVLTNETNTFVPVCNNVVIPSKGCRVVDIPVIDFIDGMKGNPYFKMVDAMQFVLDKMPEEEWEKVFGKFKDFEVGDPEDPKFYLSKIPQKEEKQAEGADFEEPTDDNSLTLKVPAPLIDVMLGGRDSFELDVTKDTYQAILETVEGNLILNTGEMPTRFYGCHFYNNGRFPYFIKKGLKFIRMINQSRMLTVSITGHTESVKEHCDFLQDGSCKPDPKGDACVWTVRFEIRPYSYGGVPKEEDPDREPNFFLLRWNPAISNQTLERFRKEFVEGWKGTVDWSVRDWREARAGDIFFMLREGDDRHAGIIFRGEFVSDPFTAEDWAGSDRLRHYCLMSIYEQPSQVDGLPHISMDSLALNLPEIDWHKGHSGEKLTKDQAMKLFELWGKA